MLPADRMLEGSSLCGEGGRRSGVVWLTLGLVVIVSVVWVKEVFKAFNEIVGDMGMSRNFYERLF